MLTNYDHFRAYLESACGIVLGDNKQYLVSSRLGRLMRELEVSDLAVLVSRLQREGNSSLRQQVIDAMTTNETLWFRDAHPFNILKDKLLPGFAQGGGSLRIWSAACSTGQEPYSIAMTVEESRRSVSGIRRNVEILATDLSKTVLDQAREGRYESLALARGLSEERKRVFFDQISPTEWRVKDGIRQYVRFQSLNLLEGYSLLGKFDIVFCRNVLIYFSPAVKTDILSRIHATLKPGGYLFLGGSEALSNCSHLYDMVQCRPGIVYQAK